MRGAGGRRRTRYLARGKHRKEQLKATMEGLYLLCSWSAHLPQMERHEFQHCARYGLRVRSVGRVCGREACRVTFSASSLSALIVMNGEHSLRVNHARKSADVLAWFKGIQAEFMDVANVVHGSEERKSGRLCRRNSFWVRSKSGQQQIGSKVGDPDCRE